MLPKYGASTTYRIKNPSDLKLDEHKEMTNTVITKLLHNKVKKQVTSLTGNSDTNNCKFLIKKHTGQKEAEHF